MGIQLLDIETPEQREINKRRRIMRRIRTLGLITALVVGARFLIKDPLPTKAPDTSNDTIRYIPGLTDTMSDSERNKINPILLAKLQRAEREYKLSKNTPSSLLAQKIDYKPGNIPIANFIEAELVKQQQYLYEKRIAQEEKHKEEQELMDNSKTMLVSLKNGGFLKAEKTEERPSYVHIQIDRGIRIDLPTKMVKSFSKDALTFKPSLPFGYTTLKPAKGIKITVQKNIANRISIRNSGSNEI